MYRLTGTLCNAVCCVWNGKNVTPPPAVHYYTEVNLYPCQEAQCHVYLIKELFIYCTKKGEERFIMK